MPLSFISLTPQKMSIYPWERNCQGLGQWEHPAPTQLPLLLFSEVQTSPADHIHTQFALALWGAEAVAPLARQKGGKSSLSPEEAETFVVMMFVKNESS